MPEVKEVIKKSSAPKAPRNHRMTLVFEGKFEKLYDQIDSAAKADDRDPDTVVLRILNSHFNFNTNGASNN